MRFTLAMLLLFALFSFTSTARVLATTTATASSENTSTYAQTMAEFEALKKRIAKVSESAKGESASTLDSPSPSATLLALRSHVQSLTVTNRELQDKNSKLETRITELRTELTDTKSEYQDQVHERDRDLAEAMTELASVRPPLAKDPFDWAALAGGLLVGTIVGVSVSRRQRRRATSAALDSGGLPGTVESQPIE